MFHVAVYFPNPTNNFFLFEFYSMPLIAAWWGSKGGYYVLMQEGTKIYSYHSKVLSNKFDDVLCEIVKF